MRKKNKLLKDLSGNLAVEKASKDFRKYESKLKQKEYSTDRTTSDYIIDDDMEW